MKVIVQVPCLNEEETLPLVLKSVPKKIPDVDSIEVLIIDDGSTDKTIEIAKKYGVKHFVLHPKNQGLARSFRDGILKSLELGADIIVNTDGDNQYPQEKIGDLIAPIIRGEADMVIADRQVKDIEHFSLGKKIMQRVGTIVLNKAAGTKVPDAPSGFRAYSRNTAMRLNTVTRFSYAMETLIQAGNKNISIATVPVVTNPKTRESRLFKSSWEHVRKSGAAIIRAYIMYRPYFVFMTLGLGMIAVGAYPVGRFVYFFAINNDGRGHIQSLIVGSILIVGGFVALALGIIADLIRINRGLIEDSIEEARHARFDTKK